VYMDKRERFKNRIINEGFVVLDGGMGSLLQARGLKPGEAPELWNISHPDEIREIHKAYLAAGSDVIITNSFGTNSLKYPAAPSGGLPSLGELVKAACDIARSAVEEYESEHPETFGKHFVGLDIGPLGRMLKPFGDLSFEDAVSVFKDTLAAAKETGVDLVYIETMNDIYEAKAAVVAAKESLDLPVCATVVFDERGKLLTGADPACVVSVLEGLGADCLGVNCGFGPDKMSGAVRELVRYSSVPVIVKPNAGLPSVRDGQTVYDIGPADFRGYMEELAGLGARLMGGCCGTTPEYISLLKEALAEISPLPVTEKDFSIVSSWSKAVVFSESPVIIGERINPTGKKLFKEALRNNDIDYVLKEAIKQQDAGADVLDVNIGLPEIDAKKLLPEIVCEIQAVSELPLQIDTDDSVAMENALRVYNGKAVINSVNGKAESMDAIFPIAKKYGGLIVALTLDESGIPETPEGRLAIAEKIYARAAEYGIKKKDIMIDPLTLTVSVDKNAAKTTLECVRLLKEQGSLSSLGVSNVSFGLPDRDALNAAFFTMALQNGLSAAIINPLSFEMMKSYRAYCAAAGLDERMERYIDFFSKYVPVQPQAVQNKAGETGEEAAGGLKDSIIKGLKDSAKRMTEKKLESGADPLDIINGDLVPALDIVGSGFEKGTIFLPQLLMAAEATSASFEVIKGHIKKQGTATEVRGRIILATVKGDIHDIGKNIVKVLMENYGFEVVDLGKDVEPAKV
ncbi:MAG: homocysteine S-methyltransferase family protein, partial [Firmicutes bacterium]|nr:homocysteine S-methyltransferase family protein [Bacillota bacterium]